MSTERRETQPWQRFLTQPSVPFSVLNMTFLAYHIISNRFIFFNACLVCLLEDSLHFSC